MGCDIHGWVEIKRFPDWTFWEHALAVRAVQGRNYDVFGLLFGVRNYTGLAPIAAGRGLPPKVSKEVKEEHDEMGDDAHSTTWVTLAELEAYDWEQAGPDARIHRYVSTDAGEWVLESKSAGSTALTVDEIAALRRGETVEKRDSNRFTSGRYRMEQIRAKDIRAGEVDRLIAIMRLLAESIHPPTKEGEETTAERVRLVVWFDN